MKLENRSDEDKSIPSVAPGWDELRERSPYSGNSKSSPQASERGSSDKSEVRDDPSGGVIVHRCHPDADPTDYFAFAQYHKTMKGYEDKNTYLYTGPVESGETADVRAGISRWNGAVGSFHFREGSHEDCAVCQGEADPADLLREVVEKATQQVGGEDNVARSSISTGRDYGPENQAFVYLDSHGSYSSGGTYDVQNSTRHWEDHIRAHPYVEIIGAEEKGEGGNWSNPDNTLLITLATYYPDTTMEVRL